MVKVVEYACIVYTYNTLYHNNYVCTLCITLANSCYMKLKGVSSFFVDMFYSIKNTSVVV